MISEKGSTGFTGKDFRCDVFRCIQFSLVRFFPEGHAHHQNQLGRCSKPPCVLYKSDSITGSYVSFSVNGLSQTSSKKISIRLVELIVDVDTFEFLDVILV